MCLTYVSEAWTVTKLEEDTIAVFERKILRNILGGVRVNNVWRRRFNSELYRIYKQPNIVKFIKINRMNWMAHVIRMNDDNTIKKGFAF